MQSSLTKSVSGFSLAMNFPVNSLNSQLIRQSSRPSHVPTSCGQAGIARCAPIVRAGLTGDNDEFATTFNHTIKHLHQTLTKPTVVGSEYGEGFVQFRLTGEAARLDVDTLNERLKHKGATRLRHALKPDEAHGVVFNFDTVVANTRGALQLAWCKLAEKHNKKLPASSRLVLNNTCPERVVLDVLGWTTNLKEARMLSWELADLYAQELSSLTAPMPGCHEWLTSLTNFNIPCALVSALDKATVRRCLERMLLHDHFQVMVTAEDDMDTMSQRFLSAALQLSRPPNHCVVFDDTPDGITAAHNCTMKAVAVAGWYPPYQLKQADVTCGSLSDLTVYNVRRLFANRGDEFMDYRQQSCNEQDHGPRKGKRVTSATL